MKRRMKILALLLATAVTATSVPYQNVVLAETKEVEENNDFSAYEAAIAQFSSPKGEVSAGVPVPMNGISWNKEADDEETDDEQIEYIYSDDLRVKEYTTTFKGNVALSSPQLTIGSTTELSYDETALLEQLGYDSENENLSLSVSYNYQWHSISQDGTTNKVSTNTYLYPDFKNTDVKKTYVCEVGIDSITIKDEENWDSYTYKASDLNDQGIYTVVNKMYHFEYVEDETSKVLLAFNRGWLNDKEQEKLSKNDTVYTEEYTYDGYYTNKYLCAKTSSVQEKNLCRAFGILNYPDYETEYAWYVEDANGIRTPLLNEDGEQEKGENCYANVYAKDGDATYVCVRTIKSVSYSEYDEEQDDYVDKTIEIDDKTLPAGYSNTVENVFKIKYTGLTKEDFTNGTAKISDFFEGTDKLEDKTVEIESFYDNEYYDAEDLYVKDDEHASMKQTWTAYFTDGSEKEIFTSNSDYGRNYTVRNYEDVSETEDSEDSEGSENTTRKYVDHYVYQAELLYNGVVIDTITKTVAVSYTPFTLDEEGNQEVSVRNNGKHTFSVNAQIRDTNYCKELKYQWYTVDKDGKETLLEGETENTLKRKITDAAITYKCKVTGVMTSDYEGPKAEKEANFSIKTSSGYRLIDRSSSRISKNVGEDANLYVETSVDEGYSVNYKWEKYEGTDETGNKKLKEIGTEAICKITELKEEDFGDKYDKETGTYWTYRVTVNVCKDGETEPVETYVYYTSLSNREEIFNISSKETTATVYKGEDATLGVLYSDKQNYTIVPQWYMAVETTKGIISDAGVFTNLDDKFTAPECDEVCDRATDSVDKDGKTIYERTYYKKLVTSDALLLSEDKKTLIIKDEANPGKYMCDVNIFKNSEMEKSEEERVRYNSYRFDMSTKEKTDLVAYMKSGKDIEAVQGEKATFVVNAGNFDTTACPITYVWEKYNEEKGDYEVIKDATTSKLSFEQVKKEDYGKYRVTVKDVAEEIIFNATLNEKNKDVIISSPTYAKFNPKVGETISMKAESNLKEQDKVFYEWYRIENTYDGEEYWELLNQDTDTYMLDVKDDKDYTTYKCVVSYKNAGTTHEQEFIYVVEKSCSLAVEQTTLTTQYKKLGDSVSYGVRALYKDAEISPENVKYQWYEEDSEGNYKEIEGATESTYQIAEIQVKDFGGIKCVVKDISSGVSKTKYFDTLLYTEAYLSKESETLYGVKGNNVTLQPEIVNAEADGYTYQWYRYNEKQEYGYWEEVWDDDEGDWEEVYHTYYEYGSRHILYGATSEKLEINDCMAGDFTKYECVISYNGMKVMNYTVQLDESVSTGNIEATSGKVNVSVPVKQRAELKVDAKSLDGSELIYQWYKEDDDGQTVAIGNATADTMVIEQVTPADYGTYTCKVSDKKGSTVNVRVVLSRTMDMNLSTDSYDVSDTVGYATTFGGTVALKASATITEGETLFYQWYKGGKKLYGENEATLTLSNVTKEDLGNYTCTISNIDDESENLYYLVYVDTGLNAVQSPETVTEAADGSAVMYVEAVANAGQNITYQWSKYDDEEEKYVDIEGATTSRYQLAQVNNKDYGEYRCVVATDGESYTYSFELSPTYYAVADRDYAQIGDTVTVSAKINNPAADANYTYQWYAEDPKTGTYMITDCTSATYSVRVPSVNIVSNGYEAVNYKCVITNGSKTYSRNISVNVLRKMEVNTTKLPETESPFSKVYDVQNYSIPNAKALKIVFDSGRDIPTVIDGSGKVVSCSIQGGIYTYIVEGDTAIFLYSNNSYTGKGYKVKSINTVTDPTPIPVVTQTVAPVVTQTPAPVVTQTVTPTAKATATPKPNDTEKTTAPGKPTLKSVTNVKGKKMTVKLSKKVKGAAGYQITYATNASFSKNKKNVNMTSTSKTIKKLKKGTTYYVKVRAYAKDSKGKKVYGAYSKVKKVKIKK